MAIEQQKKEIRTLKPLILGALAFIALGISIASEMLGRFGLGDNYVAVVSVAFVIAAFMLSKNLYMIGFVILGVIAVNLPEATLMNYGLDQDVLLAFVCALILGPSLYHLVTK
jgi:hypothetical protein